MYTFFLLCNKLLDKYQQKNARERLVLPIFSRARTYL